MSVTLAEISIQITVPHSQITSDIDVLLIYRLNNMNDSNCDDRLKEKKRLYQCEVPRDLSLIHQDELMRS